jgi:Domain of unknown function (DUF4396)
MIEGALGLWFVLAGLSALFTAWDLVTHTPAMTVMKWGWVLVVLYTGPLGLFVYLLSCREPLAGTHRDFVAPLWKQAVGSTIHCVAGDATGIIAGALVGLWLRLPPVLDLGLEYAAGFGFGLFIFQALFMKLVMGTGYLRAVRQTLLPEWLSMNALMGGMIPVMVILMSRDPAAREPTSPRFWGAMSLAILVGALTAYPVNVWLVARRLKHGMGTVQVLGRGGHSVDVERQALRHGPGHAGGPPSPPARWEARTVIVTSLAALVVGIALAARFGGLSW